MRPLRHTTVAGEVVLVEGGEVAQGLPVARAHGAVEGLVLLHRADQAGHPLVVAQVVAEQANLEADRGLAAFARAAGEIVTVEVEGGLVAQHDALRVLRLEGRLGPEAAPPGVVSRGEVLLASRVAEARVGACLEGLDAAQRRDTRDQEAVARTRRKGEGAPLRVGSRALCRDGEAEGPPGEPRAVLLVDGSSAVRVRVPQRKPPALARTDLRRRILLQTHRHGARRPAVVLDVNPDRIQGNMRAYLHPDRTVWRLRESPDERAAQVMLHAECRGGREGLALQVHV